MTEERLADAEHEINKPFARYADDVDLDRQQRDADREGDPMLDYIKRKKIRKFGGKIKGIHGVISINRLYDRKIKILKPLDNGDRCLPIFKMLLII